jgi:hypothetical protein
MSGCDSCAVSSGFFLMVSFAPGNFKKMICLEVENEIGIRKPEFRIKERFL